MEMRTRNRPKHYYAGSERVATRIGGGGLYAASVDPKLSDRAGMVFCQSPDQVNSRRLKENLSDCIANGLCTHGELLCDIKDIPSRLQADTAIDYTDFRRMIHDMRAIHHDEPDVYFYHSDHLGSASWITDNGGVAVQHLQYLPYGERYVDQRVTGYQERFTFTGKERDEETGYGYFGARYIDHELTTMWLSVDPMSDKYPGISPYAYCAWNPVKLVDPDGCEIDSTSVPDKIWNMVNPNHECYNSDFAEVFGQLANDHTTIFTFEEWTEPEINNEAIVKGRFDMIEVNESEAVPDRAKINYYWEQEDLAIAPERHMFEEVYHAKQFLDGEFGFGRTSSTGTWKTMGRDMYDEEKAHNWADRVSGSPSSWIKIAIDYYRGTNLPSTRRNVNEHYMKYDGIERKAPPVYINGVYKNAYRTMRTPQT